MTQLSATSTPLALHIHPSRHIRSYHHQLSDIKPSILAIMTLNIDRTNIQRILPHQQISHPTPSTRSVDKLSLQATLNHITVLPGTEDRPEVVRLYLLHDAIIDRPTVLSFHPPEATILLTFPLVHHHFFKPRVQVQLSASRRQATIFVHRRHQLLLRDLLVLINHNIIRDLQPSTQGTVRHRL